MARSKRIYTMAVCARYQVIGPSETVQTVAASQPCRENAFPHAAFSGLVGLTTGARCRLVALGRYSLVIDALFTRSSRISSTKHQTCLCSI